jgi:hypothetical protein
MVKTSNGRTDSNQASSRHGLNRLRTTVKALGGRVIDRRTALGKTLARWRDDLLVDLGGPEAVSVQERAIVDLAVRTKLLLDSIDAWLLVQPSLVDKRRRCVLPVVRERTQLADALGRYLAQLGLRRRAKRTSSLEDYLTQRYADGAERNQDDSIQPGSPGRVRPEGSAQAQSAAGR